MRSLCPILLFVTFAIVTVRPLFAQSAMHPTASTMVSSAGAQPQTTSSKFLGSPNSGSSSWQAGNGSFGKSPSARGANSRSINPSTQRTAASSAPSITPRTEKARLNERSRSASRLSAQPATSASLRRRSAVSSHMSLKKEEPSWLLQGTVPGKSARGARNSNLFSTQLGSARETRSSSPSQGSSSMKSQFGRSKRY